MQLAMAQAAMAYPVLNTFIHYSVTRQTRRCRSSPPELQVHLSISEAVEAPSSRTRPRRKRRRARPGDDEALSEFRSLAILEKWMMLAQKLANNYRKELLVEACNQMLLFKALERLPKKQDAMPTDLFMHTVNSLGISQASFAILFCEGALRRNGDTVEIWAPEIAAPEVTVLLAQVRRFKLLRERGEFLLRIPMDQEFSCSPIPLGDEMTVKDLRAVAAVCCGVLAEKLLMTHLGEELTPPGLLVEEGVMPGSCITVSKIIEG